jgi:hypothetical protein
MAGSAPVGAAGGEGIQKSKKKIAGDKEKGLPSAKSSLSLSVKLSFPTIAGR